MSKIKDLINNLDINELDNASKKRLSDVLISEAILNARIDEDYIKLEYLSKAIEDAKKAIKDIFIKKIKEGGVRSPNFDAKISNRTKYKFEEDATYNELKKEETNIKTFLKSREDLIKAACKKYEQGGAINGTMYDPQTGEAIAPVNYEVSEVLTISFK